MVESNGGVPDSGAESDGGAEPVACDIVHDWFGLTYAHYLTIPRRLLESMPGDWQARFVKCLEELGETFDWMPGHHNYWVSLRRIVDGRFVSIDQDPFCDYRHEPSIEPGTKTPL